MPKGHYERKPRGAASVAPFDFQGGEPSTKALDSDLSFGTFSTGVEPVSTDALNTNAAPKMVAMELKRNYVPLKLGRIVGYQKEARIVRNAAGENKEVEPAEFIEGEMFPPVFAGVGFERKIWAGTVIEVPEDEAKTMRKLGIAEAYL
jgi:hypothetical protein